MSYLLQHAETLLMVLVIVAGIFGPVLYFVLKARLRERRARREQPRRDALFAALGLPPGELSLSEESMAFCDWRAAPEEVVEELNRFLPAGDALSLRDSDDGVVIAGPAGSIHIPEASLDVLGCVAAANRALERFEFRLVLPREDDDFIFLGRPTSVWDRAERAAPRELARTFAPVSESR